MDAERVHQADEVARPADRDGRGGEQVLEQQVPADEPADEGAEGGEGVGVGAAGGRDHRGQLGVTERGEPGDDAGEDEGDQHRRPGVVGGGVAGDDEDAGADDAGDAEQGEAEGAERARVEPVAVVLRGREDRVEVARVCPGRSAVAPIGRDPATGAGAIRVRPVSPLPPDRARRHRRRAARQLLGAGRPAGQAHRLSAVLDQRPGGADRGRRLALRSCSRSSPAWRSPPSPAPAAPQGDRSPLLRRGLLALLAAGLLAALGGAAPLNCAEGARTLLLARLRPLRPRPHDREPARSRRHRRSPSPASASACCGSIPATASAAPP